jgi:hypothetical protein
MTSLWSTRTSAGGLNNWRSVTYGTDPSGNGLYVAIASSGIGNRVMTSSDGITWSSQTSAADNQWQSVTYGNGLFVAVSIDGTNRVMTSTNGSLWTPRAAAFSNAWQSVTYGSGLFVAVATSGTGNRVMTSINGTSWTIQASAADNAWQSVTYGNGKFVAVSESGTGNRVMTSTNGTSWTSQAAAADNFWQSVTYGNGKFVAVSESGTGNRVMTSTNGTTWTSQAAAADNLWNSVTYGNGLFVAVSSSGTNRVMTSTNGTTWTSQAAAFSNAWQSVTYGNGKFVAVSSSGTTVNRVMTANTTQPTITNFSVPSKVYGDPSFTIIDPSSNSDSSFNYTSSNTSVATISGKTITIGSPGNSIITATQAATLNYTSGSTDASFQVTKATPLIGPLIIPRQMNIGETFSIADPSSNSDGSFNYTSSKPSVETITSGNILTAVANGTTTITATQEATTYYTSGSVYALSSTCFLAGTLISCNQGEIPIEQINPDIHTIRGKKIVTITKTIIQNKYLICFEKGSLGNNTPSQRTIMSKNHELFYNGKMIKAVQFVGKLENVKKIKYTGEVLYNVLMEKHDKMVVNNLICETLNPEHDIAKLHTILKDMTSENKIKFIKEYNKTYIAKNKKMK